MSNVEVKKTKNKKVNKENSKKSTNVSVKSKKKNNNKKMDTSSIIMLVIFIILLITVCILFGVVINKKNKINEELVASVYYPIIEHDSSIDFSIDLSEVNEKDDYVFKITNYRGNKINDFDIRYSIVVKNDTSAKIKMFRGKGNVDLIKGQSTAEIKDLKLYSNEKEDVYFRVSFDDLDKIKKKDMINISIKSE